MFKVREEGGAARLVLLKEDMPLADGNVIRGDGVVLVNSMKKERYPTTLTVGNDDRVYLVYGHVVEGSKGNSSREIFGIEEVRSEKENREEGVWIFVLVVLGLAYFLFWRFQMRRLITNVDKKTS
ncbi:hypothetical protein PanWU01x14_016480 [Parasponia andersonii]|uniref:Uncharacterized protein n=1 Tax=Parasponia andersonii TaxID=3476 RepID=A0A2P5DZM8_PARAD|nr:hypothetical protein PanWU01x14_016480 [Parasponia andersonii]